MNRNRSSHDATDRTVIVSRDIAAPAALLFRAASEPEHLLRWYGPRPYPLTLCEVDFRVGGRFRFAMTGPDGVQGTPFGGEYLEIVPHTRIVYDNAFELDNMERMVVTLTFEEKAGRTRVTVHTRFASAAMLREHCGLGYAEGIGAGLAQMDAYLATLTPPAMATPHPET